MDMDTGPGSTQAYVDLLEELDNKCNKALMNYSVILFRAELENKYTKPLSWIGLYIVAASLLCIFAMAADLLHGLRNRKLWFPCKYFIVNAAFLSVISAAMKLPMDISTSMPGNVDQVTKLGGMAFLCTMMANFLPSQVTMNKKELITNITGLSVMVITLVVNLCIQIQTGVVSYKEYDQFYDKVLSFYYSNGPAVTSNKYRNIWIASVYLTLLSLLLIIHICSSLAILKSKEMIDEKYQKLQETPSDTKTVEELVQHVSKYWIMAGSPQFITVCFVTTSACGVICVLSTALHIRTLFWTIDSVKDGDYESDYQWSMLAIFIIQFIGVILGTIVPLCRCFAVLCFNSIESIKNHIKVFKVESYWTEKLYEWRQRSITLPFCSDTCQVIFEHVKICFLNFCIAFQMIVVVTCKIISLVPVFMICSFYCLKFLKCKSKVVVSNKKNEDLEYLRRYVLQDEMKVSETTLKCLSRTIKRFIKNGEKHQPKALLQLIKESIEGVENFDRNQVSDVLSDEDCWSLPMVTLTIIAFSLPDIDESKVENLLASVKEGLKYVTHVDECLNTMNDSLSSQKAARTSWHEFVIHKKWSGKNIKEIASKKKPREIVQLFNKKGDEDMVKKVGLDNGSGDDNSKRKSITEVLLSHDDSIDDSNKLFDHISQMIAGILVVRLTNLPKVIQMKCHTSEIEKREVAVKKEAKILGETTEIIKILAPDPLSMLESK